MRAAAYRYDIHNLVTVVSDADLPELTTFRVQQEINQPTIRVQIGKLPAGRRRAASNGPERAVRYGEGVGAFGFGIEIVFGETIAVLATPLLARSPHVLYTNVVEPILRWTFVEKGYALVHGACVALGEQAFLITARTDTGKTTTILRLLDNRPEFAFLSDDLTLLSEDGRILPYPKPLTISRHTLVAVRTPLLSWSERLALVVQSRLHSKSGRRFAFFLTATRIPMATTNAVVQAVVPPPKYPVQRLVPGVRMAKEARLAGLVVIERGGEGVVTLEHQDSVETVMANCEDSFGFPPYPAIAAFLYGARGKDLRPRERAIVSAALVGQPAVKLRSESRGWWRQVPGFIEAVAAGAGVPRPTAERIEPLGLPAD